MNNHSNTPLFRALRGSHLPEDIMAGRTELRASLNWLAHNWPSPVEPPALLRGLRGSYLAEDLEVTSRILRNLPSSRGI